MNPPCERSVPGNGDVNAHFHVIGDNPAVHGGTESGVPFTDRPWSAAFFDALVRGGLIEGADLEAGEIDLGQTFLSYLHMCDPGETPPEERDYHAMESFFDAELRAITAHVLLPVGARATAHVLENYTARRVDGLDMDEVHATELDGSGWLVVPIKDPAEWADGDAQRLVDGLAALLAKDYRQVSDLGRFLPGEDPYMVR